VTIVNTSSHEITWTHRFCAAIKWQRFLFLAFSFIGEHRRAARSQRVRAENQRVHPHASATAAMLACPGSWTSESRATTSYARGSHSPVLACMHQLKNKHAILSTMHKITNRSPLPLTLAPTFLVPQIDKPWRVLLREKLHTIRKLAVDLGVRLCR
jgi:hypothetical protein